MFGSTELLRYEATGSQTYRSYGCLYKTQSRLRGRIECSRPSEGALTLLDQGILAQDLLYPLRGRAGQVWTPLSLV